MLLKLASAWRGDAEALKRGQELRYSEARGEGETIEARCGRRASDAPHPAAISS
jgi:hypothetical protein